ncbi:hypothetical protein [Parageobacillus thermoglucosidasius]|uniref:Uncharacterized protein n=1 Tax=Parageobacillus thermoglucosidasius TaxID=1426 RepID=A0A1B7KN00_PARTM|nr:hypothetical protein [Parageobacillus thermoglucosidasius]OAT71390.1 hypothetical protein A7K69_15030 [Parageobacillus thermoglucosidasius]
MRKSKNFLAGNSRTITAKSIVLFKTAIYFFYAIPLIFVTYLYLMALHAQETFFTPVIREPIITIMFVIAMLNPFFAVLTKVAVNDLESKKHVKLSYVTLWMVAVSQLLIGNLFGSIILLLGLYQQRKEQPALLEKKIDFKYKGAYVRFLGSTLVFFLSIVCLFLLIKIHFPNG